MTPAHTDPREFIAPEVAHTILQRSLGVGLLFGVASLILALVPATRTQFFHSYLIVSGYIWRAIIYFAIWFMFAFFLNRWSREQDNPPVQNLAPRFRTISAPGIILYAFSISFAVIDWVMSLDPHWYSTIF